MTQHTIPHTRPAPKRRPGDRDRSSWRVPVALVVLSLIPVISGSLRLLEVAGAYALAVGAGTQAFTEGIGEALFGTTDLSKANSLGSGWVINAAVAAWVIRRPSVRQAARARARAALAASR